MQLARLPRWNWVIIGLVAGLAIGLTRTQADGPLYGLDVQGSGLLLSDQQQFEDGLVQDYNGIRLFSDPVVYPHWVPNSTGGKTLVYIVSGRYWDGRPQERGNQTVAEWQPRCVITHTPYRPKIGIAGPDGTTIQQYPSVRDLLNALSKRYGIQYRYAWWAAYPVWTWTLGGLLLVGGLWPSLVNLLAFGTLRRPPEVKPISLWNVRPPKKPKAMQAISFDVPASEAEENLMQGGAASNTPATPSVIPAPAPALASTPLEIVPEVAAEAREFGAKEDDYYPTERHAAATRPPG